MACTSRQGLHSNTARQLNLFPVLMLVPVMMLDLSCYWVSWPLSDLWHSCLSDLYRSGNKIWLSNCHDNPAVSLKGPAEAEGLEINGMSCLNLTYPSGEEQR